MSSVFAVKGYSDSPGVPKTRGPGPTYDKTKEWQMELLMEKLRSKAGQFKPFVESAKALRMSLLEKRYPVDSVERSQLQKCLDTLQHSIKVTSLQSMVERLECVSRQLGLKFMAGPAGGLDWFISSDMFYLEVVLEPSGCVKDVKIHHEGKVEQQSCEELVSCLSRGDFADFTAQLEGLASIYQLNAEKKVKCKAFSALQSLETDLGTLAQLQTVIKEPFNLVHKSPVGILEKRRGGDTTNPRFKAPGAIHRARWLAKAIYSLKIYMMQDEFTLPQREKKSLGRICIFIVTVYIFQWYQAPFATDAPKNDLAFLKELDCHAMRLTYLVPPYELLDQKTRSAIPLSVDEVTTKNLGYSVMVCMEGSSSHKLQTSPLITVNRSPNGKNSPTYAALSANNSATLPACFVLRLNNPMPMCLTLVRCIQQITEIECGDLSSPHPFLSLITQHASAGQLDCANNRGLFVSLPDQHHCYFMTESKNMEGILVSNIPFSHPTHVPQILNYLRQQALFNVLVASCIRPASKLDLENLIMFEITALSWQHLSISFEHPLEETMATAELDLSDAANLKCKVYGSGCENNSVQEHASKILQRCLSIPITMRSLIHLWQRQKLRSNGMMNGSSLGMPPGNDQGRHGGANGHNVPDFDVSRVKTEPDSNSMSHNQSLGSGRQGFGSELADTTIGGFQSPVQTSENSVGIPNSFQLGALLSGPGPGGQGKSPIQLLNILGDQPAQPASTIKKSRKRKGESGIWRSPKRKQSEDCEIVLESSSSDSTPLGTPTSRDAPMDVSLDCEPEKAGSDFAEEEIMELDDMEDMLKTRKPKKEKKSSPPTIILDLPENKNIVPPSVSITPITSSSTSFNSVLTGMGLERRPGIEIIPICSGPQTSLPSSITITPISSKSLSDDRSRERKSGKSRNEEKIKLEKKRKRQKREDSPSGASMGPPDKLPIKQDPLSKPVSVSIKPTESPPLSNVRPASPAGTLRKITSSPTHMSLSVSKSGSNKPSSHQSPKHSPGYTTSSPKHHGTSSPKHQSSGSSGKPSMSALKSAASSPSTTGKSSSGEVSKVKSSSSSNKDKDRKVSSSSFSSGSSSSGSSPKLKSSSVKLKQLDLSSTSGESTSTTPSGGTTPPSGNSVSGSKTTSVPQVRNRKGSLSAVIDKLTAQHSGPEPSEITKEGRSCTTNPGNKTPGETNKNPGEYMVKPSSDGMKLTINKTRTKDSKSGSIVKTTASGSGSPKTHTGLKPGVNSGPASKKPHQMMQQKTSGSSSTMSSSGSSSKTSSGNQSSKVSVTKSSSSPVGGMLSKSVSKSSGSPKMTSSTDSSRRDNKPRPPKSSSDRDKSVFPGPKSSDVRKSSPVGLREDNETFKMLNKLEPTLPPQLMVEGLMKSLDTKFQIPKLSARNNPSDSEAKKSASEKTTSGETSRIEPSSKPIDLAGKGESGCTSSKFPVSKSSDENKNLRASPVMTPIPPAMPVPPNQMVGLTSNVKTNTPSLPPVVTKAGDMVSLDTNLSTSVTTSTPVLNLSVTSPLDVNAETHDMSISGARGKSEIRMQGAVCKEDLTPSTKLEPVKCFSGSESSALSLTLPSSKTLDTSSPKYTSSINVQKSADDSKKVSNITSDIVNKIPNKMNPTSATPQQEAAEILLDFSSSSTIPTKTLPTDHPVSKLTTVPERALASTVPSRRNTPPPISSLPPPTGFPNSPSVSVHIVKSPATSPLVTPSPHSVSPCITDDELMDEALVGMGK
ncbi:Mediator of RNA polymerase II transcription subunit 1 [Gryllus bimaculatus]|nr:Mediator of RNA polymerase II transcription subunit 1 [Gryllus bimaculatus]